VILTLTVHLNVAKKLEGWTDPEIHGSVEPQALRSAARNPKLFWGVSHNLFYVNKSWIKN